MPEIRMYTQTGDGPIHDSNGRALLDGTPTWVLVNHLMRAAEGTARATGSTGATNTEVVFGVEVVAGWKRNA